MGFFVYLRMEKNRIKRILALKDLNVARLSEMTGLNYHNVARWCRNVNQPTLCDAYKIAKALDVKMEELLQK